MADCADLSFTWNLCLDNIEFEWQGFSDSLCLYVVDTLKRMIAMRSTDIKKIFDQAKEQLLQQMKNFYLKNTYKIALKHFETIMVNNSFEQKHLMGILEAMDYQQFADMHVKWLKSG